MDTLSYKTKFANQSTVVKAWHVIDAEGQTVGRLCTQIAKVLRGKHKPSYTPHTDTGDYVIIVNAKKVEFSGLKWKQKIYQRYSGYTGGQKERTATEMLQKFPERIIEHAVKGMLPKTKLGRQMYKKLFVYSGAAHPHAAQQPKELKFS